MVSKKIPDFYVSKDNIIYYLVFLFFYTLIFVNVFTPFKGAWYNLQDYSRIQLFTDTLVITVGGIVVLMLSRILMYYVHKKKGLTVFWYVSWQIIEVLLIAFLYAIICRHIVGDNRSFSEIFSRTLLYVPLIISIPTLISHLFFSVLDKNKKLMVLTDIKSDDFVGDDFVLDNHITSPNSVDSEVVEPKLIPDDPNNSPKTDSDSEKGKFFNFLDEKDDLQISLLLNNIYYIESAENYINIYYRDKENIERFTMRSSLKKQFDKLEKHGFLRCHRSYVVNFSNIALLRREKDGPYLDFGVSGLPKIPISKTYIQSVTEYFIQNS